MMKERGRGGVVQNFQTGGSDPAKQVISERVRGNESVPGWVVSIGGHKSVNRWSVNNEANFFTKSLIR